MANSTDPKARNVHGTNPQYLIEKIVRIKIYESMYWKTHCFALSAEGIVDKAVELRAVGGTYGGNRKPTNFLCLLLKMLQIQPEKEIISLFISNYEFKYLRVLGATYLRIVGSAIDIYQYLEPLLNDYRKVRYRQPDGKHKIVHVDEIVDSLLQESHYFDIKLPHLKSRRVLESNKQLGPRESWVHDDFDNPEMEVVVEEVVNDDRGKEDQSDRESRSRSRDRDRRRSRRSRSRSRDRDRRRRRSSRSRSRSRSRRRSRSRDRDRRDRDRDRRRRTERSRSREKTSERRRSRSREREEKEMSKSRMHKKLFKKSRSSSKNIFAVPKSSSSSTSGRSKESMSIEETNEMRKKLGMKPLKV